MAKLIVMSKENALEILSPRYSDEYNCYELSYAISQECGQDINVFDKVRDGLAVISRTEAVDNLTRYHSRIVSESMLKYGKPSEAFLNVFNAGFCSEFDYSDEDLAILWSARMHRSGVVLATIHP